MNLDVTPSTLFLTNYAFIHSESFTLKSGTVILITGITPAQRDRRRYLDDRHKGAG